MWNIEGKKGMGQGGRGGRIFECEEVKRMLLVSLLESNVWGGGGGLGDRKQSVNLMSLVVVEGWKKKGKNGGGDCREKGF